MNELLQSVHSIFRNKGYLHEHGKENYNIPAYQRGYKWTRKQVERLLEDINLFDANTGKFYCVQNITLVPNKNQFNVVDGQQRLTTMLLLLSILGEHELIKGKLQFPNNSIREQTNNFLQHFILSPDKNHLENYKSWNQFIQEHSQFDLQDIYYLFHSYKTIHEWINNHNDVEKFKDKLLHHVKFICNNIDGENEEKIFGNLNSKRIYLDGADLVRAILITRVNKDSISSKPDIKYIVRINERRVRIGWQLDEINNWWSQPEIIEYYEPWIKLESSGDIQFNTSNHPVNRLYLLLAESEGCKDLNLDFIENYSNPKQLYQKIIRINSTLKDWYNDKIIYHYLGFLFNQKNRIDFSFKEVWYKWETLKTRNDFKKYLLNTIKEEIFGKESIDQIFEESKNWYEGDKKTLVEILLLLDIVHANKEFKDRLESNAFNKKGNDIEHIFPQNPEKPKDKVHFIRFLLKYDNQLAQHDILKRFNADSSESTIGQVDDIINKRINEIPIHSIGNLVLLYDSLNRSISNRSYSYKRKRVMDYFNDGNFIQPHTLKVFARYFKDSETSGRDLEYWSKDDIIENEYKIKNTLINFFKKELENE